MIARHLTKALKDAALDFPVVTVTGPRQSGKGHRETRNHSST